MHLIIVYIKLKLRSVNENYFTFQVLLNSMLIISVAVYRLNNFQ